MKLLVVIFSSDADTTVPKKIQNRDARDETSARTSSMLETLLPNHQKRLNWPGSARRNTSFLVDSCDIVAPFHSSVILTL